MQRLDQISTLKTETHYNQRIKEGFCFPIKPSTVVFLHKNNPLAHLLLHLMFFSVCAFSDSDFMDSTPPSSKRLKTRAVRSGGRLEGCFFCCVAGKE